MRSALLYAGLGLVFSSMVEGHIAMWNKGLFGYNWPGQASDGKQNYNTNVVVSPMRKFDNRSEIDWWAHGMLDYPPAEGDFMELPSGGNFTAELSCNRAWTTMRHPGQANDTLNYYACPDKGPLHTANTYGSPPLNKWLGGTAIAIVYESNTTKVKPTDFTVITVNYTSVWSRETIYQIPKDMPKCPEGGCLCTWNWIHQTGNGEGYGQEMYNTLYRCNITGSTGKSASASNVKTPQVPALCESDSGSCVTGPKQPMYTYQTTGNNIVPDPPAPPTYNARYGFADGAQTDIYTAVSGSSDSGSTSSKDSGAGALLDPRISGLMAGLSAILALALGVPNLL